LSQYTTVLTVSHCRNQVNIEYKETNNYAQASNNATGSRGMQNS